MVQRPPWVVIVRFFCAVASGQPFMIRVVKELPMTKEQEAVAQGIATPEHYQRRQFMSETERAPKLKRDVLGSWQCRSGNICSADLVRNGVEAATIAFR